MDRRRLFVGAVWLAFAVAGTVRAEEPVSADGALAQEPAPVLDLLEPDPEDGGEVQPQVDCSDGRPDSDCLSGRLGASMAAQTCNGLATIFSAGNCSVSCSDGYYACGKCGWGGFASCTCREVFTCNPNAP